MHAIAVSPVGGALRPIPEPNRTACFEINPTFDVCKRARCAPYPAYLLLAFDAYLDVLPPEIAQKLSIAAIDGSGQRKLLPLPQNFAPRASFPADTAELEFAGDGSIPLYYAVAESGFQKKWYKMVPGTKWYQVLQSSIFG